MALEGMQVLAYLLSPVRGFCVTENSQPVHGKTPSLSGETRRVYRILGPME